MAEPWTPCPSSPTTSSGVEMDFSFRDARRLSSHVKRLQTVVDKKRRWLECMIPKPDGCSRRPKRPKLLSDSYLNESDVRSGEVSFEKVRASVAKCFCLQYDGFNHHFVQDGLSLFNLQKEGNDLLSPESLDIVHHTISKLSNEALQSVASIISRTNYCSSKSRRVMRRLIMGHLPSYLAKLDDEDTITSQLAEILRNPCSYRSDSLSLVTLVSPLFLSSINLALDGLDGVPEQVLVAVNKKLVEKPCPPKFWHVARCSSRGGLTKVVRKRCEKIIAELKEGQYLPKSFNKLAKAISVLNLYRKQKLKSMEISQSEVFPFPKEIISLQNDVLNALWSLPKIKRDVLKLLRPILDPGHGVHKIKFKVALQRYLMECLFECDGGNLPEKAIRAIAFINQVSQCKRIALKEIKDAEVEAVLNVSSHLRSLAYYTTEECPDDEELMSLESDTCSEDNDFILVDTNCFQHNSKQQMDEPCCSNDTPESTADVDERCSSESVRAKHGVSQDGDSISKLADFSRKPYERTRNSGYDEALEKAVDADHSKAPLPFKNIPEICDETSTAAHMLIGQVLDRWLLMLDVEVDELSRVYLGGGSVSQVARVSPTPSVAEETKLKSDILVQAVESIFPTLPKSCIDRVKRLMS